MIEITPAILTADPEVFAKLIKEYSAAKFKTIDIDIAQTAFAGHDTLTIEQTLPLVVNRHHEFGWHLMMQEPETAFRRVLEAYGADKNYRIYIHQEADIKFMKEFDAFAHNVGLAVKVETNLRSLDYYAEYPEVQFMTVEIGVQGGKFQSQVMDKVNDLRSMGYVGKISLDGSINLQTANHLHDFDINRVSVGSYFQNSGNLDLDWQKLNLALNLS